MEGNKIGLRESFGSRGFFIWSYNAPIRGLDVLFYDFLAASERWLEKKSVNGLNKKSGRKCRAEKSKN